LGLLIRVAYYDMIYSVGVFYNLAAYELKSKTSEDMWEGELKRGVWNHYYVSYSRFDPLILPRAAFKDEL